MRPIQVIAITGGKGGVGKSNISVNLAVALAELGRRVVLLDADFGLANIDVLLGISTKRTIEQVLSGECSLLDIMVPGPGGIRIVPASSGTRRLVALSQQQHAGLVHAFSDISEQLDVLIIDTAAGVSDMVVNFVRAANEVIFVVCDEPTSITDAYALMKILSQQYEMYRFRVMANMVRSEEEGERLHAKLTKVSERFLDVILHYLGSVPYDEHVRKAVQRQKAVMEVYPRSRFSVAMRELAEQVDCLPLPNTPRGHLEFFVDKLTGMAL